MLVSANGNPREPRNPQRNQRNFSKTKATSPQKKAAHFESLRGPEIPGGGKLQQQVEAWKALDAEARIRFCDSKRRYPAEGLVLAFSTFPLPFSPKRENNREKKRKTWRGLQTLVSDIKEAGETLSAPQLRVMRSISCRCGHTSCNLMADRLQFSQVEFVGCTAAWTPHFLPVSCPPRHTSLT